MELQLHHSSRGQPRSAESLMAVAGAEELVPDLVRKSFPKQADESTPRWSGAQPSPRLVFPTSRADCTRLQQFMLQNLPNHPFSEVGHVVLCECDRLVFGDVICIFACEHSTVATIHLLWDLTALFAVQSPA